MYSSLKGAEDMEEQNLGGGTERFEAASWTWPLPPENVFFLNL
jgi:hypothetical protein